MAEPQSLSASPRVVSRPRTSPLCNPRASAPRRAKNPHTPCVAPQYPKPNCWQNVGRHTSATTPIPERGKRERRERDVRDRGERARTVCMCRTLWACLGKKQAQQLRQRHIRGDPPRTPFSSGSSSRQQQRTAAALSRNSAFAGVSWDEIRGKEFRAGDQSCDDRTPRVFGSSDVSWQETRSIELDLASA